MADTTRRRMLGVLATVPLVGVLAHRLSGMLPRAWSRPAADGTSATRCAACGASGHAMLDPLCPARPRGLV